MLKLFETDQKGYPTRPNWSQKGNKRVPNDADIAPKSSLGAFEFLVFVCVVFRLNCKNDHGALVGLTNVKGTRGEILCLKNINGKWFLTLVGLTLVKGRSVRKRL